ncbi:MAG: hypothetical protein LBK58_01705 [Prevotellaceae bacterium]|nr:hypothetical protein [Prevotellaceae bacterium]
MNALVYNICKINMLCLAISLPLFLSGQSGLVDSLSDNFVSGDTVISENVIKTPVEDVPKNISPASPMIPMNIRGFKQSCIMMPPRYWGYERAKNKFRYTVPEFEADKLSLNLDFSTYPGLYHHEKLYLNLDFAPPKNILELIRENPLRALVYGAASLAGMMNNTIMGEDKMNKIRLDNMVQSRSGIPETMISNQTVIYEIDIKKHR